ncbi:pancreatic lipase-related protein 2-like [Dendropsophus ebraccatus]|uniref:pancreatic lipase-related protein 2-like n=1 Tax=Dendropsophus ebraccatus TaxID=150705 RepID=UPI003831D274
MAALPVLALLSVLSAEECYDRLGCFTNKVPWAGTLQRPVSRLPWAPEKMNIRFLLYTRDNLNSYQQLSAINNTTISKSNFQPNRKTHIIIHGFLDNGQKSWMVDMCQAILQVENINCICVDWKGGSQTLYTQAANNIRVVGAEVAYFVNTLEKIYNYPPSNVHLIGHSLGAHTAGEAGKRQPGIGRITGLDPAGPYFSDTPPEVRLDPSDALLVDAIHTDATPTILHLGYGMSQTVGHLDFFPNGGKKMPGCKKSQLISHVKPDDIIPTIDDLAACNHLRSYKYYTESILTPDGFIGFPSSSYDAFKAGKGFPCPNGGCPSMGHYADQYRGITPNTQTFYLNTGDAKTFSRWRYKVTVLTAGNANLMGNVAVSIHGSHGTIPDYIIYKGLIKPGATYTAFIDAAVNLGSISKVTFVWHSKSPNVLHRKLGTSNVTVQFGKDGAARSFCDSATVPDKIRLILSPCSSTSHGK